MYIQFLCSWIFVLCMHKCANVVMFGFVWVSWITCSSFLIYDCYFLTAVSTINIKIHSPYLIELITSIGIIITTSHFISFTHSFIYRTLVVLFQQLGFFSEIIKFRLECATEITWGTTRFRTKQNKKKKWRTKHLHYTDTTFPITLKLHTKVK